MVHGAQGLHPNSWVVEVVGEVIGVHPGWIEDVDEEVEDLGEAEVVHGWIGAVGDHGWIEAVEDLGEVTLIEVDGVGREDGVISVGEVVRVDLMRCHLLTRGILEQRTRGL